MSKEAQEAWTDLKKCIAVDYYIGPKRRELIDASFEKPAPKAKAVKKPSVKVNGG